MNGIKENVWAMSMAPNTLKNSDAVCRVVNDEQPNVNANKKRKYRLHTHTFDWNRIYLILLYIYALYILVMVDNGGDAAFFLPTELFSFSVQLLY